MKQLPVKMVVCSSKWRLFIVSSSLAISLPRTVMSIIREVTSFEQNGELPFSVMSQRRMNDFVEPEVEDSVSELNTGRNFHRRKHNASIPLGNIEDFGSLPVFLKFHKVGGTTIASCLRDREQSGQLAAKYYWCCDNLWEEVDAERFDGFSKKARKVVKKKDSALGRNGADYSETGCKSGGVAYEHNTLSIYKEHGLYGFSMCTAFRPKVKAFTVLRSPVAKWLSGLYYWGKVYTNPNGRICLARKYYEDIRLDISEAYRRLTESPEQVEVRDVDMMSACIFGDRFIESKKESLTEREEKAGRAVAKFKETKIMPAGRGVGRVWNQRPIPGPPGGSPSQEYVYWLNGRVANETNPSRAEIDHAKHVLGKDFTVGLTEQMPSFFVLVAMSLGWPLEYLCCVARNVNEQTGSKRSELHPSILEHGKVKLAADIEIYEEAKLIHARQVEAAGPNHAVLVKRLSSSRFQDRVCHRDSIGV